ncbi:MAG: hypothetical protein M3345_08100 [Actinomycetota bacterium]|nr:hypothetical protein [Actinomycetota bacterium]
MKNIFLPEGRARVRAVLFVTLVVAFVVMALLLLPFSARIPPKAKVDQTGAAFVYGALALVAVFLSMGALVAARQPRNPVGWIFMGVGLLWASGIALEAYAQVGFYGVLPLPGWLAAAWVNDVTFQHPASFGLYAFFFLLFPDGHLPSKRWRIVGWLTVIAMVGIFVSVGFRADLLVPIKRQNPLGIQALTTFRPFLDIPSNLVLLAMLIASIASMFVRLRRAHGDARQQIKWFLVAASFLVATIVSGPLILWRPETPQWIWPTALLTSLSLLPVTAAIAILKYRLYDIDLILNRTLVYGSLTAILAGTYVALVTAASSFVGDSPVAVAAATLAVAALFQPLRRRVQDFIDHRFYRRKYDAEKTVESFSARLRDEIDLDTLSSELLSVVEETMQPARVSLWLRPSALDGGPVTAPR